MENVRLCVGRKADNPYYFNTVCMNVYCVEEICYLFALNPFMISDEIMLPPFINWLKDECNLPDLALRLNHALSMKCRISEYVNIILNYVNYCTPDEIEQITDTLKTNAGLSNLERKKQQADYLLKNNRFEAAVEEYEALLNLLPEIETSLKPLIYQNIGYAYAKLFMFETASRYYKRSFEISGMSEVGIQYLASLRMYMSDEEYLSMLSSRPEFSNLSLMFEKRVKEVMDSFEGSRESIMLNALKIYKDEGNVSSYFSEIDEIISDLKTEYIKQVTD